MKKGNGLNISTPLAVIITPSLSNVAGKQCINLKGLSITTLDNQFQITYC
jgi:hypothetical protein